MKVNGIRQLDTIHNLNQLRGYSPTMTLNMRGSITWSIPRGIGEYFKETVQMILTEE